MVCESSLGATVGVHHRRRAAMSPTMLRSVLQAVAEGRIPCDELSKAAMAVGRGLAVDAAVARLCPDAPPADELNGLIDDAEADRAEDDADDHDELAHLFEALRVCRRERGPCLLLAAAIASDWGVDAELLVGVDADDEVDALLAAGDVDEAVELAREGAEALDIE